MCTVLGNAVFHIYEHFRLTSATLSALKEGETYSASFRNINATVLPCYFFFFFCPPLPTSQPVCSSCLSVSAWDLCWMRESAFVLSAPHFKALCLCRLMRKQGGLLQTSQWETAGLLLPDGGWTTAHWVFREPSSSLVREILLRYCLWCIEVFSPRSTLLLLCILCSLVLQHLRFFVLEINSNVDVTGT